MTNVDVKRYDRLFNRFTNSKEINEGIMLIENTNGDYSFDKPLEVGDKLVFCDMAIYTMVKNNTFNGMPLPWIYLANYDKTNQTKLITVFGYEDFKGRL